jgi:hypothetical protein
MLPVEAYLGVLASALVTVTGLFYKNLLDRIKRSEDREERLAVAFERLADQVETILDERERKANA